MEANIIHIKPPIIVKDLAEMMGVKPFKLIQDLMELDVFANPSQSVEPDVAAAICEKHGFVFEKEKREKGAGVHKVEEVVEEPPPVEEVKEEELQLRAPIITFMGHVDHGKTSLLDALRKSQVVSGEAGGITQHIGAYSIEHGSSRITLIDTPGHAAFTEMRARGAHVTDIVVLVVAAGDGVMPQTKEAIDHAQAAEVTIIVAINKIDTPGADVNKVKAQLQDLGLTPEDWGGDTVCAEVSATEGTGLDELLELMALQAEVLELKANPNASARATAIEARLAAGKGPTATVIVGSGTLRVGNAFICGPHAGKVKSLFNDRGEQITEAGPAMPVEVLGFSGLPHVGDELVEMDNERTAKRLSEERLAEIRQKKLAVPKRNTLESLFESIDESGRKVLRLVLKTDVAGSAGAIVGSLNEIESEKIDLGILHSAAGPITESDILLASASDAIIVGFNTKVESKAVAVAKHEGVQIKLYSIIYELIDQVREAMLGLLDPETRENVVGHAEVKEVFKLSSGRVAGCMVSDGRISRKARARVLRGGQPVYDGGLATLRRFQDDVNEVRNGLECGIKLGNFNEYEVDDVIECYELENLEPTL
ncbi:MAG: translation initiation factor IF-2 [Verrucomicrobiales bacterium]